VEWAQEEAFNSGVLSVYSAKSIIIKKCGEKEGQALWEQMLMNFATQKPLSRLKEDVDYSMHWMRGQMVCYA
jgi:hypothetical protein